MYKTNQREKLYLIYISIHPSISSLSYLSISFADREYDADNTLSLLFLLLGLLSSLLLLLLESYYLMLMLMMLLLRVEQ